MPESSCLNKVCIWRIDSLHRSTRSFPGISSYRQQLRLQKCSRIVKNNSLFTDRSFLKESFSKSTMTYHPMMRDSARESLYWLYLSCIEITPTQTQIERLAHQLGVPKQTLRSFYTIVKRPTTGCRDLDEMKVNPLKFHNIFMNLLGRDAYVSPSLRRRLDWQLAHGGRTMSYALSLRLAKGEAGKFKCNVWVPECLCQNGFYLSKSIKIICITFCLCARTSKCFLNACM